MGGGFGNKTKQDYDYAIVLKVTAQPMKLQGICPQTTASASALIFRATFQDRRERR
jgi:hypothetical protein